MAFLLDIQLTTRPANNYPEWSRAVELAVQQRNAEVYDFMVARKLPSWHPRNPNCESRRKPKDSTQEERVAKHREELDLSSSRINTENINGLKVEDLHASHFGRVSVELNRLEKDESYWLSKPLEIPTEDRSRISTYEREFNNACKEAGASLVVSIRKDDCTIMESLDEGAFTRYRMGGRVDLMWYMIRRYCNTKSNIIAMVPEAYNASIAREWAKLVEYRIAKSQSLADFIEKFKAQVEVLANLGWPVEERQKELVFHFFQAIAGQYPRQFYDDIKKTKSVTTLAEAIGISTEWETDVREAETIIQLANMHVGSRSQSISGGVCTTIQKPHHYKSNWKARKHSGNNNYSTSSSSSKSNSSNNGDGTNRSYSGHQHCCRMSNKPRDIGKL